MTLANPNTCTTAPVIHAGMPASGQWALQPRGLAEDVCGESPGFLKGLAWGLLLAGLSWSFIGVLLASLLA